MRVAACRSLLVLLAAGAAIPRPVAADACPPAILEEPYQEGQDVVMRAGGWALLWRDSDLETVNLPLPSETATSWCSNPRAIGCSPVPCGEVRDRCVLPDRYTYRMQAGFYDYDYTIDVHDSGDVCLDGCARVAWLDMQVDEAGVSFVLMSDGPGRLPCGHSQEPLRHPRRGRAGPDCRHRHRRPGLDVPRPAPLRRLLFAVRPHRGPLPGRDR